MDTWKFYDITHRDHAIMNPIAPARLDAALDALLGVLREEGARGGAPPRPRICRVVDFGCGKGETLVRLAERAPIRGVGVDLSPHCVRDARERAGRRVPGAALEFVLADGASYGGEAASIDAALCVGATWIFGGYRGTLAALARLARPGGAVLVAEPYWRYLPPEPAYLASEGLAADTFGTHEGNLGAGAAAGLDLAWGAEGVPEDWDVYEGLQWRAAERYARERPDDPDVPEIVARVARSRDSFLRWGREGLGQGIYLFRRDPGESGRRTF